MRLDAEIAVGVDPEETTLFTVAKDRLRSFALPTVFAEGWRPIATDGPDAKLPPRFAEAARFLDATHARVGWGVYDLRSFELLSSLPMPAFGRTPQPYLHAFEGHMALIGAPRGNALELVDAYDPGASRSFGVPNRVETDEIGFQSFHDASLSPDGERVAWIDWSGVWAASLQNDPPVWIHRTMRSVAFGAIVWTADGQLLCVLPTGAVSEHDSAFAVSFVPGEDVLEGEVTAPELPVTEVGGRRCVFKR